MTGHVIPDRDGDPPVVSGPSPHEQVTQTAPAHLQERVFQLAVALPADFARAVEKAGWGERHPETGSLLLFGPRDEAEAELVCRLLRVSYRYALGEPDPLEEPFR